MTMDPLDRANLDQAIAAANTIAELTWAQYRAFRLQGFTEEQALRLTINYSRRRQDYDA